MLAARVPSPKLKCCRMDFNDASTPLSLLLTRRSGKARDLAAPGPDEAQLATILTAASRVPDHGKLAPWRFVIVPGPARGALADLLESAYREEKPDAGRIELQSMRDFAAQAPALVVVMSRPIADSKIPLWEQELSAGAACMNLLAATHALGFRGAWLTGWPAFSPGVAAALGEAGERIAGFIFLGSSDTPLDERPRPALDQVVRTWEG